MDSVSFGLAILPVVAATGAWVRRVEVELAERRAEREAQDKLLELHEKRLDRFEEKLDKVLDRASRHQ